jgi:hypothetical protein
MTVMRIDVVTYLICGEGLREQEDICYVKQSMKTVIFLAEGSDTNIA